MLAEMIDKIVSLKETKVFQINGHTWADRELNLVEYEKPRPVPIDLHSLDAVCRMVREELGQVSGTVFVSVEAYDKISVFTTFGEDSDRTYLYRAKADAPGIGLGWRDIDKAIIELRSLCIPGNGVDHLLGLLSNISFTEGMEVKDNGVGQEVKVKSGVSMSSMEKVKPRVELQPFRTFLEVEQPASEFVVRLDKARGVGLFEADGGIWKLEAKRNIAKYLGKALEDLTQEGRVVVLR